jgi:hypothetical protein
LAIIGSLDAKSAVAMVDTDGVRPCWAYAA